MSDSWQHLAVQKGIAIEAVLGSIAEARREGRPVIEWLEATFVPDRPRFPSEGVWEAVWESAWVHGCAAWADGDGSWEVVQRAVQEIFRRTYGYN